MNYKFKLLSSGSIATTNMPWGKRGNEVNNLKLYPLRAYQDLSFYYEVSAQITRSSPLHWIFVSVIKFPI